MSEDHRFIAIEASINNLTVQVDRMVGIVERLATVEERNAHLALTMGRVEAGIQRQIDALDEKVSAISAKTDHLNQAVVRFTVILGLVAAGATVIVPALMDYLIP